LLYGNCITSQWLYFWISTKASCIYHLIPEILATFYLSIDQRIAPVLYDQILPAGRDLSAN